MADSGVFYCANTCHPVNLVCQNINMPSSRNRDVPCTRRMEEPPTAGMFIRRPVSVVGFEDLYSCRAILSSRKPAESLSHQAVVRSCARPSAVRGRACAIEPTKFV